MTHLQKLKSIRLCLPAHPDNESGSEFADRISDLDELIKAQESADAALMDDFAKAAMQAIIGTMTHPQHPNWGGKEGAAYHAYEIANLMMQERGRRMKG